MSADLDESLFSCLNTNGSPDAVVQFSWWIPPSTRSMERAAQIEAARG